MYISNTNVSYSTSRRRRVQDVVDVSISVKERRNPYQLLFRVKEQSQGRVFTRAIDHRILDKILEPLFKNQASAAIDTSFEIEREDAMLDWVRTGKPPKRKQMISWMLDRMWICQVNILMHIRSSILPSSSVSLNTQILPL